LKTFHLGDFSLFFGSEKVRKTQIPVVILEKFVENLPELNGSFAFTTALENRN
jgi:hypothetical protein